ncbi:MAG: hypothetical protein ABI670_11895 [Chloroflexota bacterium]
MKKTEHVRTHLLRVGNSTAVILPARILAQAGLPARVLRKGEKGPQVELTVEDGVIRITPYGSLISSFEDLAAPLLEQVGEALPEAQDMVLRLLAAAVDWLTRSRTACERLVPVVRMVYQQNQLQLEGMKERGQRLFERDDIVWSLVLSTAVSSQSDIIDSPALSYEAVHLIADVSFDPVEEIAELVAGLGGIDARKKEAADVLLRAHELIEEDGGLQEVTKRFHAIESRQAVYNFLHRFRAGSRGPYSSANSLNNPLDELYQPAFRDQVQITGEMQFLLDKLQLSGLALPRQDPRDGSQSAYEQFYQQVAVEAGLEAWLLEQMVRLYYREINNLLDKQQEMEPGLQTSLFHK